MVQAFVIVVYEYFSLSRVACRHSFYE